MPPITHLVASAALLALASGCSAFLTRPSRDPPTRQCPSARWPPGLDLATGAVIGVGAAISMSAAAAASADPDDEAESRVISFTLVGLAAAATTVGFIASGVSGYLVRSRCQRA